LAGVISSASPQIPSFFCLSKILNENPFLKTGLPNCGWVFLLTTTRFRPNLVFKPPLYCGTNLFHAVPVEIPSWRLGHQVSSLLEEAFFPLFKVTPCRALCGSWILLLWGSTWVTRALNLFGYTLGETLSLLSCRCFPLGSSTRQTNVNHSPPPKGVSPTPNNTVWVPPLGTLSPHDYRLFPPQKSRWHLRLPRDLSAVVWDTKHIRTARPLDTLPGVGKARPKITKDATRRLTTADMNGHHPPAWAGERHYLPVSRASTAQEFSNHLGSTGSAHTRGSGRESPPPEEATEADIPRETNRTRGGW